MAFGDANNTTVTVLQLLQSLNGPSKNGSLYYGNSS